MTSHILRNITQKQVQFDPTNPEHLEAFSMLCIGQNGRQTGTVVKQHPHLRFVLEDDFVDVRSMMLHKVGKQYLQVVKSLVKAVA